MRQSLALVQRTSGHRDAVNGNGDRICTPVHDGDRCSDGLGTLSLDVSRIPQTACGQVGGRALDSLPVVVLTGYTWVTLHYAYSLGERFGYVQKISNKGWLCNTWEGELATFPAKWGWHTFMGALSESGASRPITLSPAQFSKIDWHDARTEYDQSVADLLAAIQQCSTFPLSDAEKCLLIESAREREQSAFIKYIRALDAR